MTAGMQEPGSRDHLLDQAFTRRKPILARADDDRVEVRFWWPWLSAVPMAAAASWVALSLVLKARKLHRGRAADFTIFSSGQSSGVKPTTRLF